MSDIEFGSSSGSIDVFTLVVVSAAVLTGFVLFSVKLIRGRRRP